MVSFIRPVLIYILFGIITILVNKEGIVFLNMIVGNARDYRFPGFFDKSWDSSLPGCIRIRILFIISEFISE